MFLTFSGVGVCFTCCLLISWIYETSNRVILLSVWHRLGRVWHPKSPNHQITKVFSGLRKSPKNLKSPRLPSTSMCNLDSRDTNNSPPYDENPCKSRNTTGDPHDTSCLSIFLGPWRSRQFPPCGPVVNLFAGHLNQQNHSQKWGTSNISFWIRGRRRHALSEPNHEAK